MKKPDVVSSKLVFDGYFKIRRDTLRYDNGYTSTYDYMEPFIAVAVLPIIDDEILLLKQYRHPLKRFTYDLPAGAINSQELLRTAARRELEEETGYYAKKLSVLGRFNHSPGSSGSIVHLFAGTELTKTKTNQDKGEVIEVVPIKLSKFEDFVSGKELEPIVPLSYYLAKGKGLI
ncbi:hypothetical protein A2801_02080 [Candidatus Woesebacteria bacterium RIFCSPHIGHO2_01_FULL_41_10]|uniref:Nudix hydrolase domain-containing protein n=1 Tax=Candidatus Woesebacteria bacterium RIFCSPHIGHO2_01_FULL_41_10 TaxID=1802500 RepID=A0A1F7YPR2_9BACT|nr:MAG: hypothetical protein A2801_02080 [Candidatus Woesebacteria bacterium RIFCSPHIGHO2_01_FULL_41_10]